MISGQRMKYILKIYYLFFLILLFLPAALLLGYEEQSHAERPNIIVLLADDLGYGDLSSYGSHNIRTPHIDSLAEEGMRFTSYLTGSLCVPSRTQLMTGLYLPRVGYGGRTGVGGKGGLPDSVITLAEGLKEAGYHTGMAGKWHLGYQKKKYLPTGQGFDSWLGLPYSHDYQPPWYPTAEPLRMYRNNDRIKGPVTLDSLTVRYTNEATRFITEHGNKEQPFFFYLAYNMPHLPIRTTTEFRGRSKAGLYGDVVETIDWSVGQILHTLKEQGISENTLLFFASDNGPWKTLPRRMLKAGVEPRHQGSTGSLRGSKRTTYEGGTRVPGIIRWPTQIPAGQVSSQLAATPDIYQTLMEIGGAALPPYPLDGYNLMPWLSGQNKYSPRNQYAYFLYGKLEAMVVGDWKLRIASKNTQLFNLKVDPEERFNRAKDFPKIVRQIRSRMLQMAKQVGVPLAQSGK